MEFAAIRVHSCPFVSGGQASLWKGLWLRMMQDGRFLMRDAGFVMQDVRAAQRAVPTCPLFSILFIFNVFMGRVWHGGLVKGCPRVRKLKKYFAPPFLIVSAAIVKPQ
jgi:hypothetical protein